MPKQIGERKDLKKKKKKKNETEATEPFFNIERVGGD